MDASDSKGKVVTVDADGHVLEPRDVWQRYLEPNLRARSGPATMSVCLIVPAWTTTEVTEASVTSVVKL